MPGRSYTQSTKRGVGLPLGRSVLSRGSIIGTHSGLLRVGVQVLRDYTLGGPSAQRSVSGLWNM